MSISVAMAVYNGEKFIEEQINSILPQLKDTDELVISYDKSSDKTYDIISNYAKIDQRVKVIDGPGKGAIYNFENAIINCTKEYIFLCDQDDVWVSDKVETVLKEFSKTNADLILHDAVVVDENLNKIKSSFFKARRCKKGILRNIIKNSYIGCCMAFNCRLKMYILPFPKSLPMHDQWIGLVAEKYFNVHFLNKQLIKYRRHKNNVSNDTHSDFLMMLKWRLNILKGLFMSGKR